MDPKPAPFRPQELAPFAAILMVALLVGLLLSIHGAQAGTQPGSEPTEPVSLAPANTTPLGSAALDLNALARIDNVDESDNIRWSLVRNTPAGSALYNPASGVDWAALRNVTAAGFFKVVTGFPWKFNTIFGDGDGYKQASGVLAGGQCALATVFRAAAMQAGLPTKALPHASPVPGFPQDETVTIWWGTYDLKITNPTGQDLYLVWKLTPDSVKVSIESQIPS